MQTSYILNIHANVIHTQCTCNHYTCSMSALRSNTADVFSSKYFIRSDPDKMHHCGAQFWYLFRIGKLPCSHIMLTNLFHEDKYYMMKCWAAHTSFGHSFVSMMNTRYPWDTSLYINRNTHNCAKQIKLSHKKRRASHAAKNDEAIEIKPMHGKKFLLYCSLPEDFSNAQSRFVT